MPVIRYRTRDLTRLLPGTARTMRRMEKVTGRSDDMMIIRGVNVFPTQIEEQLFKVPSLSAHYQIELTAKAASTRWRSRWKHAPTQAMARHTTRRRASSPTSSRATSASARA